MLSHSLFVDQLPEQPILVAHQFIVSAQLCHSPFAQHGDLVRIANRG